MASPLLSAPLPRALDLCLSVCRLVSEQRHKNAYAEQLEGQALKARMEATAAADRIQQCQNSLRAEEGQLASKKHEISLKARSNAIVCLVVGRMLVAALNVCCMRVWVWSRWAVGCETGWVGGWVARGGYYFMCSIMCLVHDAVSMCCVAAVASHAMWYAVLYAIYMQHHMQHHMHILCNVHAGSNAMSHATPYATSMLGQMQHYMHLVVPLCH